MKIIQTSWIILKQHKKKHRNKSLCMFFLTRSCVLRFVPLANTQLNAPPQFSTFLYRVLFIDLFTNYSKQMSSFNVNRPNWWMSHKSHTTTLIPTPQQSFTNQTPLSWFIFSPPPRWTIYQNKHVKWTCCTQAIRWKDTILIYDHTRENCRRKCFQQ